MKRAVSLVCLATCFTTGCGSGGPTEPRATNEENSIFVNLGEEKFGGSCEHNGIATGDTVAVSEDIELLDQPNGEKVINEKATAALGRTHYQSVDHTEVLRELCRTTEWSKIQVVEPHYLNHVTGWLPSPRLRVVEQSADGNREYVAEDFYWDDDTSPYKGELVAAANRIVRENENCTSIDPGTLAKSPSRSTPNKSVYFITCNSSAGQPFNVWFERGDALSDKSFAAIQNVDRGTAVQVCEQAAKAAANNPQTVDFSRFMDVAFLTYPSGRSRLLSSFTAKNSFGVEGKFTIGCLFEGSQLIETVINEAT